MSATSHAVGITVETDTIAATSDSEAYAKAFTHYVIIFRKNEKAAKEEMNKIASTIKVKVTTLNGTDVAPLSEETKSKIGDSPDLHDY